jgi:dihydropyrimidinase
LKVEPFDLVIRGGTVVTATDMMRADIGIRAERIAAIAEGLDAGRHEIDARGLLVLPGGVDTHSHIEQLAATGLMNADTFESATRSAAFGGTTTVISFAAQHVGMNLTKVVEDYHRLADKGAGRLRLPYDPRRPDRRGAVQAAAAARARGPFLDQGLYDV